MSPPPLHKLPGFQPLSHPAGEGGVKFWESFPLPFSLPAAPEDVPAQPQHLSSPHVYFAKQLSENSWGKLLSLKSLD